jgi:dolichyl-phosphate beta-glucosyltransferase
MLEARGAVRLFSDADLSTPIEETEKILRALRSGADVAVASRRLGRSVLEVKQPWYREFMGRSFNLIVQSFAVRGITDTQCGFKGFVAEAARTVFRRAAIDRFGFDVELLYLARKLGFRIAEIPVRWIDSPDSRVNPLRDPYRMFLDVLRVRKNDLDGRYRSFGRRELDPKTPV